MEWQPIETAPKGGTRILAWAYRRGWEASSGAIVVCAWHGTRWGIMGAICDKGWADIKDECTPTHWMPLPPPPQ